MQKTNRHVYNNIKRNYKEIKKYSVFFKAKMNTK